MAAGHRLAEGGQCVPDRQLVGRVADAELGGDGEGLDLQLGRRGDHRVDVEGVAFVAVGVVAAVGQDDRATGQGLTEAAAIQLGLGEADEDQADRAAVPLDQGVGGQGRRQRHQGDGGGRVLVGRCGLQDPVDGFGHPDRQVPPGPGLGRGDDAAAGVEQDGVGVGPAGVDPDPHGGQFPATRSRAQSARSWP